MSDTPTPPADAPRPASGDAPAPEPLAPAAPRQKRPWTILGRLSKAVREQNWFAVVLELAIVVLGVLIAFQVTAWGQVQSDAAREDALLRQIVADLNETEQAMLGADNNASVLLAERAGVQLIRAFYSNVAPPADSLLTWFSLIGRYAAPEPTLAGVEALLSGGDRVLLGDSTLHVAITQYLRHSQFRVRTKDSALARFLQARDRIGARVDPAEIFRATSPQRFDSLATANPFAPGDRSAFPFDLDEVLRDREVYNALVAMYRSRNQLRYTRSLWLEWSVELREQIEAHLDE